MGLFLGDDVGGQAAIELGDLVAQGQFLFLETRNLQLVRRRLGFERLHGGVEILMCLTQLRQGYSERGFGLVVLRLVVHRDDTLTESGEGGQSQRRRAASAREVDLAMHPFQSWVSAARAGPTPSPESGGDAEATGVRASSAFRSARSAPS